MKNFTILEISGIFDAEVEIDSHADALEICATLNKGNVGTWVIQQNV